MYEIPSAIQLLTGRTIDYLYDSYFLKFGLREESLIHSISPNKCPSTYHYSHFIMKSFFFFFLPWIHEVNLTEKLVFDAP